MQRVSTVSHDDERAADDGFTLVEALVAMVIFVTAMSVMTSVVSAMTQNMRQADGVSLATDQARLAFQRLDKQVRYADGVSDAGMGVDGAQYVEIRLEDPRPNAATTGRKDEACRQWRVTPAGELQTREWELRTVGVGPPTIVRPQPWLTIATGIVNDLAVPADRPFNTTIGATEMYRHLSVNLRTQRSTKPIGGAQVKAIFYARNTPRTASPAGICNQRGRF